MRVLCVHATAAERAQLTAAQLGAELLAVGLGKAAAASALAQRLAEPHARPEVVLAFGVCGAFRGSGLSVGDTCLIAEDQLADEGVDTAQGFLDLRNLDPVRPQRLRMDSGWTERARDALGLPVVTGITVSTCSGTDALAHERHARTGAAVETMEGAALALCCHLAGVPLLQLRSVSNFTGARECGEWDLPRAVAALESPLRRLCAILGG
ncbi:MAG: futalosine hydrolase [Planctomycetes bacterium]|nr:futalosine hydrolase [Planctomycetota bacterium]